MQLDTHPTHTDHGLLADGGKDMVHAVVHTSPVPSQPPPALVSVVRGVSDRHGQLVDWELADSRLPLVADPQQFEEFHGWRSTFAVERAVGERALATSFVRWAGKYVETSDSLTAGSATLGAPAAIHLKWQLDQARQACKAHPGEAIGLFVPGARSAPIRGFVPEDPPVLVLGRAHDELSCGPTGLELRHHAGGESASWLLTGWHSDTDGLRITTSEGTHAIDDVGAELLRVSASNYPDVEVRSLPLQRLFAPLLMALGDAAALAIACHTGLTLYSGWRTGSRH
ncbi:MAG TPA: hypothetical protein VIM10_18735 [Actinopolymorphaceae bacterium]